MNRIIQLVKNPFRRKRKLDQREIIFAPSERISCYEEIAKDFLPMICNQLWEDCWVSDLSSIWDFLCEDDREAIFERVQSEYGIDISDIEDGNLLDIFDRLY
ncbi:MAG: hypothetical protein RTV31_00870 [Candidatus Thorarchaeota archaeon]